MSVRSPRFRNLISTARRREAEPSQLSASLLRRTVGLLLLLLTFSGCGSEPIAPPLRLAVNPWPGYSFVYLAEENGYFADEGVSVQLLELASLADARRVFEQDQVDLTFCTLVEVLLMNEEDYQDPVRVIATVDYSNGSDMLLVRDEIHCLADIRGRRIGVEPGSVDGLSVFLALSSIGLSMDDVTLVPLAQSEMLKAMSEGQVDAVQTYPPSSDAVEQLDGVRRIWDSSQAPGTILDVLAARSSVLGERPEEVRALLRAYRRAQEFYRHHPDEAVTVLAHRCRLDEDLLRRSMSGLRILNGGDAETRRLFDSEGSHLITNRVAEGLISIGMLMNLPRQVPFDSRFLDSSTVASDLNVGGQW